MNKDRFDNTHPRWIAYLESGGVTYEGKTLTISGWSKATGISYQNLMQRMCNPRLKTLAEVFHRGRLPARDASGEVTKNLTVWSDWKEWAEKADVPYAAFYYRTKHLGWDPLRAATTPLRPMLTHDIRLALEMGAPRHEAERDASEASEGAPRHELEREASEASEGAPRHELEREASESTDASIDALVGDMDALLAPPNDTSLQANIKVRLPGLMAAVWREATEAAVWREAEREASEASDSAHAASDSAHAASDSSDSDADASAPGTAT